MRAHSHAPTYDLGIFCQNFGAAGNGLDRSEMQSISPALLRGILAFLVIAFVTVGGYNMHNLARSGEPANPEWERSYWYQYYFHSERGRRGLERNRNELCELLWRTWSPLWGGARQAFPASAPSLHNPDFVDVVIHSYRHRYGLADGDPRYQRFEDLIAQEPHITVPTVVLESGDDGVGGPAATAGRDHFTGRYSQCVLPGIGHNVPQEDPDAFAQAVVTLL